MSEYRRNWVIRAFKKLDKNSIGVVDANEMKALYEAKNHPDVKSGKKSEDDALMGFIDTFETFHNFLLGKEADPKVTAEEFEEYYTNISSAIDNDEYFVLTLRAVWKLDDIVQKAEKAEEETKYVSKYQPRTPIKTGMANVASSENMLKMASQLNAGYSLKKETIIDSFRKALATRGPRGILGLLRQFRVLLNSFILIID